MLTAHRAIWAEVEVEVEWISEGETRSFFGLVGPQGALRAGKGAMGPAS